MNANDIVDSLILCGDMRRHRGRLKDEINHCARALGLFRQPRNNEWTFTEADAIIKEFRRAYPERKGHIETS